MEMTEYEAGFSVSLNYKTPDNENLQLENILWTVRLSGADFGRIEVTDLEGKGPYILEMQTYRYRGHSMSDPAKYRSKEEVQKMREEHDPIEQVRARLLRDKGATEDELKAIDAKVRAIVAEAAEFATNDPEPDPSELWTDITL
jgi:hypothetical protein